MCVCAYMHNEILILEEAEKENKGETVINDENDFVRNTILSLKSIIEEANYTYENMLLLYTRFPQVKFFYDHVGTIIKKHIKAGEPWIPALVILMSFTPTQWHKFMTTARQEAGSIRTNSTLFRMERLPYAKAVSFVWVQLQLYSRKPGIPFPP